MKFNDGRKSNFNGRIVSILLVALMCNSVFVSNVGAYKNPGFFHIYSNQEVQDIRQEAATELNCLNEEIERLKEYDVRLVEPFAQRARLLFERLNVEHTFERSNFKEAANVIDAIKLEITGIHNQIEIVKKKNLLEEEKRQQIIAEQNEFISAFKRRLFKNLDGKVIELKAFLHELGYTEKFGVELNSILKYIEKVKSDANFSAPDDFDQNHDWDTFSKNVERRFFETKEAVERMYRMCDALVEKACNMRKALEKEAEERKKKRAEEEEKMRKRKQEEETKKLIISQQNAYFKAQKEALVQNLQNKLRDLRFCLEKSKVGENFEGIVQATVQQAQELENVVANMNFGEHLRNSDNRIFAKNIENHFANVKANLEQLCKNCDDLIKEIAGAQKDFETDLINSSRDSFDSQLYELRCKITDAFEIREMDEKDEQIIKGMKADLLKEHDQLALELSNIVDLRGKVKFEQRLSLFLSKIERCIERKKIIVERFTTKMKMEEKLTARHDFNKQLELLRKGEIQLDEVIGGYEYLKREVIQLEAERQEVMRTQTGNPTKGILVYGVPGVGKTTSLLAIAASLNRECVMVRRQPDNDAMRKAVQDAINRAAEISRSTGKPTFVLFDELDAIAPVRTPGQASDTPSFLASVDNLDPRNGVILLATTNILDNVDSAAKRPGRFERKIEMSTPTETDTKAILKVNLIGYKLEEGLEINEFAESLATVFRNKTGAEINRSVETAIQMRLNLSETKRRVDVTLYRSDIEQAAAKLQ
jgi:ATP-dependent 26S proteasome regulatory subunit